MVGRKIERVDYVFSYWLFFSFVLFYFHVIPYNPKHVLILAALFGCVQFIFRKVSSLRLFLIIIITVFIKFIPIYLLRNTTVTRNDDLFYLGMFVVYIGWLLVNKINLLEFVNAYPTPFTNLIVFWWYSKGITIVNWLSRAKIFYK